MHTQMPYIIAHRGFHVNYPENTLSAFEAARDIGAHGIELDVHINHDGELFVFHDPWIRMDPKGRRIRASRLSVADLKELGRKLLGQPIPRLKDVLDACINEFQWINIELKDQGARGDNPGLIAQMQRLLRHYPLEKIIISSFHPLILRKMKDWEPRLLTGFLMQPRTLTSPLWQFWLRHTAADFYHPRYDWYFRYEHLDPHPKISLWTLDDCDLFKKNIKNTERVFSVITNRPDLWVKPKE